MIDQAFADALRMANRVSAEMETVWNQRGRVGRRRRRRQAAWARTHSFCNMFGGSTRHILIRRVRRRIHRIRTWLDRGRIVVKTHDAGKRMCDGANAFATVPRKPLKINLCPPWFTLSESRRAAVVIHELVHELGFRHPEGTTSRAAALALASRNSRRARRSPENFEHLYETFF